MTAPQLVDPDTGEVLVTLPALEAVIERGLATFVDVGTALMTIRDERLYREHFDTFEAYCRERWGFGRSRSYQMIEAAEVVNAMSTFVDTPRPTNEGQARALAPLKAEPERAAEAMRRAAEATDGKPTAEAIREAVAEVSTSARVPALRTDAVRQLARLCRRLSELPASDEFVARHRDELRDHLAGMERAYSRLGELLLLAREDPTLGPPAPCSTCGNEGIVEMYEKKDDGRLVPVVAGCPAPDCRHRPAGHRPPMARGRSR